MSCLTNYLQDKFPGGRRVCYRIPLKSNCLVHVWSAKQKLLKKKKTQKILILWISCRELSLTECYKINVDTFYFPFDGCLLLSNGMHTSSWRDSNYLTDYLWRENSDTKSTNLLFIINGNRLMYFKAKEMQIPRMRAIGKNVFKTTVDIVDKSETNISRDTATVYLLSQYDIEVWIMG